MAVDANAATIARLAEEQDAAASRFAGLASERDVLSQELARCQAALADQARLLPAYQDIALL